MLEKNFFKRIVKVQSKTSKDIKPTHAKKWSKSIFNILKPNLIDALIQIVNQNKILNRGPKPDPIKIDRFLEAFWEILDNGSKTEYIAKNHKISLKTYYRYLKLVIEHNLLRQMHANLLKETCSEPLKCLIRLKVIAEVRSAHMAYYFR